MQTAFVDRRAALRRLEFGDAVVGQHIDHFGVFFDLHNVHILKKLWVALAANNADLFLPDPLLKAQRVFDARLFIILEEKSHFNKEDMKMHMIILLNVI